MGKVQTALVSPVLTAAAAVFLFSGSPYDTQYYTGTDCSVATYSMANNCGAFVSEFASNGTGWQMGGSVLSNQIWLRVGIRF